MIRKFHEADHGYNTGFEREKQPVKKSIDYNFREYQILATSSAPIPKDKFPDIKRVIENVLDESPPSGEEKERGFTINTASGGKSAEEILKKWLPGGVWVRKNILSAMEEYASQYAHQQPVQGYSREQMEDCFKAGYKRGWGQSEFEGESVTPTFEQFIRSQQPVNDGWVRVEINPDEPRCY